MAFQFPPINYLYLVAALVAAALALFSLGRVSSRSGYLWVVVLLSFVVWNTGELIANSGTTLAWQLAFQRLVYLGGSVAVVCWLFFALIYSGNSRWLTFRSMAVLLVVPVCSLLMVMTLEWHPLLYEHVELVERNGYLVLSPEHGVGYWMLVLGFGYPYTLIGSLILLRMSLQRPGVFRWQAVLLGTAALLPLASDILFLAGVDPAGGFDPTPLYFVLSAVLVTFATQRYHFLSLTPIARDRVFETIGLAVAVCNRDGNITDANPAFARLTGEPVSSLTGKSLHDVLSQYFEGRMLSSDDSTMLQGRLVLDSDQRQFDVSSERLAGNRSEMLGMLVILHDVTGVQQALDRIGRLATTDTLTELPNRRALEQWTDGRDTDGGDLVVVTDIDHFKRVNDAHGHDFGDHVLSEVSRLMAESLRPDDNIARWGGEEFCIVLSNTPLAAGRAAMERLRRIVEHYPFVQGDLSTHITMTFGVVEKSTDEMLEEAIRRADLLMYVGKQDGRNRVVAGE
ncbi:MAG: histidine kinase N-terminal 7TM domain-containing protein [Pseudohongiellaceae bacterium]